MKIEIPEELGEVVDSVDFNTEKQIVIIPKRVINPGPYEKNTACILELLAQNYKMDSIMVDGAEGPVDVSWFKAFPDSNIRSEVSLSFLKKGEITGAEHFAITTKSDVKLTGIEDRSLYLESLKLIGNIQSYLPEFITIVEIVKDNIIGIRKKKNDSSIELEDKLQQFNNGALAINNFFFYLSEQAEKLGINLEQSHPDFDLVVDKFRDSYGMSTLFKTLLEVQSGENSNRNSNPYEKINIKQAICRCAMSDSQDSLIRDLRVSMADPSNSLLAQLYNNVLVMEALTILQGTPQKFSYFKQRRHEFSGRYIGEVLEKEGGIKIESSISDAINLAVPIMERFYEIAEERQNIYTQKTLDNMTSSCSNVIAMNFVGFSQPGVVQNLRERKISYTILAVNDAKE
jgi:hypothetical protein